MAVQPHQVKLHFRKGDSASGGLVPYTRIEFPVEAVQKIIIGPGNQSELLERAIRQMLDQHGYGFDRVQVEYSGVPFRG